MATGSIFIICQTQKQCPFTSGKNMEPKECFLKEQFGYCWLEDGQWLFQAVDVSGKALGDPLKVELGELVFHHDEDEELH